MDDAERTVRIDLRRCAITLIESDAAFQDHSPTDKVKLLTEASIHDKLRTIVDGDKERYEIRGLLGEGAIGQVYSVLERNCSREVAIKVLKPSSATDYPDDIRRFLREASISAELEHPAIIPVYELNADAQGTVYMSMRKIRGQTLGQHTEDWSLDDRAERAGELTEIFIKICDALSFAHSKGHVHQDLKPANIMIGDFGGVFVIDWGASSTSGDQISVTPVFMSPEQATGAPPTPTDDVYCLGATLHFCLTNQLPTTAHTLEELVKKRTRGEITPLPLRVRDRVPAPLLAIAMKAMEKSLEKRYPSAEAFADDLRNYSSGLSVSAYQDSLWDFSKRFFRRHQGLTLVVLAVLALLGVSSSLLYQFSLKQRAYWGEPIYQESFDNSETWKDYWTVTEGEWAVQNGRLVTIGPKGHLLRFNQKLQGSTAIEFEGEMIPGKPMGDLSILITPERAKTKQGVFMQIGAYNNAHACILLNHATVDFSPTRLKQGQRYKIRYEIDGTRLSIYLNNKRICHYEDLFPHNSFYLRFYGYFAGKAFDNVKVYSKGVPELVPVTHTADSYYRRKLYDLAMQEYDEIIRSHEGRPVAQVAQFKKGLCLYEKKRIEQAFQVWEGLAGSPMDGRVRVHRLLHVWNQGHADRFLTEFEKLYPTLESDQQLQLRVQWMHTLATANSASNYHVTKRLIELRSKLFPNERIHDGIMARHYLGLDPQYVLDNFQHQRHTCAQALLELGRYEEVLKEYPAQYDICAYALIHLKRFDELVRDYPNQARGARRHLIHRGQVKTANRCYGPRPGDYDSALMRLGPPDKVITQKLGDDWLQAYAHLQLANLKEAKKLGKDSPFIQARILLREGRYDDVIKQYPNDAQAVFKAMQRLGRLAELPQKTRKTMGLAYAIHIGDYAELLTSPSLAPADRTRILLEQGRMKDALNTKNRDLWIIVGRAKGELEKFRNAYPHRRGGKLLQLMDTGQAQKAVDDPHQFQSDRSWVPALMLVGRYDEVIRKHWYAPHWANAMLYRGKADTILKSYPDRHSATIMASYFKAIESCAAGTPNIPDFKDNYVGYGDLVSEAHNIIGPAMQIALGKRAAARKRYQSYYDHRKLTHKQELWHMIAFILGDIDESGFSSQPSKISQSAKLLLAKAIKAELNGKPTAAKSHYQAYGKLPSQQKSINAVWDRFVKWRLAELSD